MVAVLETVKNTILLYARILISELCPFVIWFAKKRKPVYNCYISISLDKICFLERKPKN